MSTTTVHCLDGTSYERTATTVGELKKAYEREHGAPVDTQEVWACSSGLELDNSATLADEDKVQLVIDEQTVTVCVEDQSHEVECRHRSTVGDVFQTLKAKQGVTDVVVALDAKAYDATGVITTENVVSMEEPVHEYVDNPLRMLCIHLRPTSSAYAYHVDVGAWKLQVELPWLRTTRPSVCTNLAKYSCCASDSSACVADADSWRGVSLQLDGTRPDVAAFITLLTTIQERLTVATGSTLELQVPPSQRIGYWKCDVRNDDQGEDVAEAPSEVLTAPHYVRGIVQCTNVWNCGGYRVPTWVARSLEYRALPDAAAAPPCIE
jgi:hypothetical protein